MSRALTTPVGPRWCPAPGMAFACVIFEDVWILTVTDAGDPGFGLTVDGLTVQTL